jgi:S-(hydroxymethyl)glutathione dehydrogenase/alcohol dehydrogenase
MKIRAAVLEEFGRPLSVQELDLAEPKAGEALVRVEACGVCHTDLYTASGADPSGYVPTVLGHEGAGVVEAVGDGVTLVRPGDHVITLFSPECGECVHCTSGKTNICMAIRETQGKGVMPDGTPRLSRDGEPIRHFMGTSTFAEYTVMPEIALAKIDREAGLDVVCTLACGAATGLGAAMYKAEVEPGSTCAVFGAGLVGLGAIAGCKLRGAERIIAVDLSVERLEVAKKYGATDVIVARAQGSAAATGGGAAASGGAAGAGSGGAASRSAAAAGGGPAASGTDPDPVQQILDMTGGFGADYTFEATGNVGVMRQAVEAARMGWGVCTILGVAGKGETLDIVPRYLITGRRVAGSSFGGVKGREGVPELVRRWMGGEIDVDPFISHRIKLDDVNRGFELMEAQDGIRSVIEFG